MSTETLIGGEQSGGGFLMQPKGFNSVRFKIIISTDDFFFEAVTDVKNAWPFRTIL
jgi:hypothetical protein